MRISGRAADEGKARARALEKGKSEKKGGVEVLHSGKRASRSLKGRPRGTAPKARPTQSVQRAREPPGISWGE